MVEIDGRRRERALNGRQGIRLVAYLAARRLRPATRDELIDALWPEAAPSDPGAALTVVLSKLRSALGPGVLEGRSRLRLALRDPWIDLEAAREAIHRAEATVARMDWVAAWGPSRVALSTAERGFLPGHDAPWIEEQRRAVEDLHLRALRCVGEAGLGLGGVELPAAERAGRALIAIAPFRESGHELLMRTLEAGGDVPEALRVFDRLRVLLREELGASPSEGTAALHRRLLGGGRVSERST